MRRLIAPILLAIPFAAAQLLLAPLISFNFIGPNFLLLLITFYGVKFGHNFGSLYGFLLGLVFDLISGGLIGSHMFVFTLAGFISGYFYREDDSSNLHSFQFFGIVFLTSSLSAFLASIFSGNEYNSSLIFLLFEQGILPGLYTSLLSFPVLFIKTEKGLQ